MQQLYQTIFYSKKVSELFTGEAMIKYMLQFESALAQAQAKLNVIPSEAAAVIIDNCAIENINKEQLIKDAGLGGNINIPLTKQLTSIINHKDKEAAKYVHFGVTSQDVIDTAIMLQCRDAANLILEDLHQLIKQLILLAEEHKDTVMAGRSFMQHARPITFGYKIAGWLDALLRSQKAIRQLLKDGFTIQMGGAAGTLHGMQQKGVQVSEEMSRILKLNTATKPWHTQRDHFTVIATTLAILSGNINKIAKDVSLLMQTEIAEVFEPSAKGKGGSSAIPHKRNPVGCIAILANGARVPSLVATMLTCMSQDHERATGYWHAEWETLSDIVQLTAGALNKAVELTNGLEIDKEQMLHNINITKGLIYAENISMALADKIGKADAHELVEQCSKQAQLNNVHLKEIIQHHAVIIQHLKPDVIEELFNPSNSIGVVAELIKNVLDSAADSLEY